MSDYKLPTYIELDRHQAHCKPGKWVVYIICHPNLRVVQPGAMTYFFDAVVDDFGDLVRVS